MSLLAKELLLPQMRVLRIVINTMGWRMAWYEGHLSSMRARQNTRWEDRTLCEVSIKESLLIGLGINQSSSYACAEDYSPATTLITIVMAGEDQGRGTCLFKSFGCSKMLLCLTLFRII